MATLKKRVNLTIDNDLYDDFEAVKELRNETSLSSVILDLAKEAKYSEIIIPFRPAVTSRERVGHLPVLTAIGGITPT